MFIFTLSMKQVESDSLSGQRKRLSVQTVPKQCCSSCPKTQQTPKNRNLDLPNFFPQAEQIKFPVSLETNDNRVADWQESVQLLVDLPGSNRSLF